VAAAANTPTLVGLFVFHAASVPAAARTSQMPSLTVTVEPIAALDAARSVEFTVDLLWAEARRLGLPDDVVYPIIERCPV
jgi:hypothetical protein